jgi:hypothetical protein
MNTASNTEKIPLPFATAAVGLCLSYLFPDIFGPVSATLVGFAIGILLLYLVELQKTKTDVPESKSYTKCPNCGNVVDCGRSSKR